jgi:DNA invertase Pin-like site-specific DNA recombinase
MGAIYARVSSEQQREANTIASQTASLIEFAKNHDLEIPQEWVFEDDGYSGTTLERPGLEHVRDLAAEGQIQVVLAYAPDRLSRKYAYQILLIEELARNGVEALFVKAPQGSSAEDQLLVQFQGMIAEYERAQILERSRRGKRHRAGRPSHKPVVWYKGFLYQAASWKTARRVVAKVEFHTGELFPRVGFIVTNLETPSRAVVRFYNKRGTAEQWIKEGKQAVKMTRLSCHRFRSNQVRLGLSLLAYNLGNLWRRLTLPKRIENWSLTSLQQRLVKTGGRLIKHARYYWLLLAESHLTRRLFGSMVRRIAVLSLPAG